MTFTNKIVWITGASSGIGEALAYEFATQGATLVLSARRTDRLESVRKSCSRSEDHMVLPLDVSMPDTHAAAYRSVFDRFGRVDILVNNSGIGQRSRISKTKLHVEQQIMKVNFFGAVSITHTVLPDMLKRDGGRIVVISSVLGKISIPLRSSYAASKHALHGYFESLRAELAGTGVNISMIIPGYIQTDISLQSMLADGSEHGKMDSSQANGMAVDVCARKIVKAIRKGRNEVHMGGMEIGGIYFYRFLPGLYRKMIPRLFPTKAT